MSYSIIKADINLNKNDIFNIWERNYPGVLGKKYGWIYENNPAGKAHVWLLKHDGTAEYVGVTALFPRKFLVNGKMLLAGIAGDLVVDKEHRSLGPAIMLQKAVTSAILDGTFNFIYGFPNKASEPVFKRVGYQILGERVRLVKIFKTAPQISRLPFGKYWGFFLSPVLDIILKLSSAETWFFRNKKYTCKEMGDIDERFDRLWDKRDFELNIAGERKTSYLKWKFFSKPHSKNRLFVIFDSEKYIKGYIIYHWLGKTIEIKDLWFKSDREAFSALISCFLKHAQALNAESVIIALLKNDRFIKMMRRFWFIKRDDEQKIFVLFSKDTLTFYPSIEKKDNWFLLQSDDDM